MKPVISLGAYGWRHGHWLQSFYPADLPDDWQLTYYSNEFDAVLVPVHYWLGEEQPDCAVWLADVHAGFRFFVECDEAMLAYVSAAELSAQLQNLRPQLAALVFLNEQPLSVACQKQFAAVFETLQVDVFSVTALPAAAAENIWRVQEPLPSSFAWIENQLTDLRAARGIVEDFVSSALTVQPLIAEATLIVDHPQLTADNLRRFRSLLAIMGY